MYIVSHLIKPVSMQELQQVEQKHSIRLPLAYQCWMQQYGEGTYSGWMNVQRPDSEILKPFVEYDLWEHTDETPINQQQLQECVCIGTSVDGDFLAVHAEVEGLIWLPRHDEQITLWPCGDKSFAEMLDQIYCGYYQKDKPFRPAYYEPWNEKRKYTFYHYAGKEYGLSMKELAGLCQSQFSWDLVIEDEYTCKLFRASIGGYVRFNYAYGREIALFFEEAEGQQETEDQKKEVQETQDIKELREIRQFLLAHYCAEVKQRTE
ncbi:SMI1/KNR4 family protein [Paenibacillus sp. TC-CSREp1]|uniref:SMI1/KNR4 family protein n=1 Tax=Paenibacillus sp. TC-CSREp1 TaxID=3410089 RepID=UPI003CF346BD